MLFGGAGWPARDAMLMVMPRGGTDGYDTWNQITLSSISSNESYATVLQSKALSSTTAFIFYLLLTA